MGRAFSAEGFWTAGEGFCFCFFSGAGEEDLGAWAIIDEDFLGGGSLSGGNGTIDALFDSLVAGIGATDALLDSDFDGARFKSAADLPST